MILRGTSLGASNQQSLMIHYMERVKMQLFN